MTQIALGSTVAALAVPASHRRAALLAGALLGTLPDLDTLPLMLVDNPVTRMTWHRAPSHSLLVLPFAGWSIWALLRRRWLPVKQAPQRWMWAIQLALSTHPLLDSFTAYGTQLLWPLPVGPMSLSSMFIVDPGYTAPLLLGVLLAAWVGARRAGAACLLVGLLSSSGYLGWSLLAKGMVERDAVAALSVTGRHHAPRFSVPMPLTTLSWRVVVMTPDGYLVGERSLLAGREPMRFRAHASDTGALAAVRHLPAVERLTWFNGGYMRARVDDDRRLVLSDLRMGHEPGYLFNFVVAERTGGRWGEVSPPQQLPSEMDLRSTLSGLRTRIWGKPVR
nr:metal-dependent hydrolase [Luteimonas sp. Y-2-2-4F]